MGLKEWLTEPVSKISVKAGSLGVVLAGLPMAAVFFIVIPAFFILLGAGLYITFQLLPFILAGGTFFFCYWLGRKFGIPEKVRLLLAGSLAIVALLLPMVKGLADLSMGLTAQALAQSQAGATMTVAPTVWWSAVGILFVFVLVFGVYLYKQTGHWRDLTMALFGLGFSVAIGVAFGAGMTQGMVMEPPVGAQFIGTIILWIFGGVIMGAITYVIIQMMVMIISIVIFILIVWGSGKANLKGGARLIVVAVLGGLVLYVGFKDILNLPGAHATAIEAGMPPVPLIVPVLIGIMLLLVIRALWGARKS